MYSKQAIANNIRKARTGKGYSQEYVSYKLKMSQNGFSKIEQGVTNLTLERAIQLAELLEVDLIQLITAQALQKI